MCLAQRIILFSIEPLLDKVAAALLEVIRKIGVPCQ